MVDELSVKRHWCVHQSFCSRAVFPDAIDVYCCHGLTKGCNVRVCVYVPDDLHWSDVDDASVRWWDGNNKPRSDGGAFLDGVLCGGEHSREGDGLYGPPARITLQPHTPSTVLPGPPNTRSLHDSLQQQHNNVYHLPFNHIQ